MRKEKKKDNAVQTKLNSDHLNEKLYRGSELTIRSK